MPSETDLSFAPLREKLGINCAAGADEGKLWFTFIFVNRQKILLEL
jgi:hypothetical protein